MHDSAFHGLEQVATKSVPAEKTLRQKLQINQAWSGTVSQGRSLIELVESLLSCADLMLGKTSPAHEVLRLRSNCGQAKTEGWRVILAAQFWIVGVHTVGEDSTND